jgi:hypothetical protein
MKDEIAASHISGQHLAYRCGLQVQDQYNKLPGTTLMPSLPEQSYRG